MNSYVLIAIISNVQYMYATVAVLLCFLFFCLFVDGQSLISNRKISIPTVVVLQGESTCTQPCEQQMVCESVQLCERSVMCQSDESEAALIFCLVMVHRRDYTH